MGAKFKPVKSDLENFQLSVSTLGRTLSTVGADLERFRPIRVSTVGSTSSTGRATLKPVGSDIAQRARPLSPLRLLKPVRPLWPVGPLKPVGLLKPVGSDFNSTPVFGPPVRPLKAVAPWRSPLRLLLLAALHQQNRFYFSRLHLSMLITIQNSTSRAVGAISTRRLLLESSCPVSSSSSPPTTTVQNLQQSSHIHLTASLTNFSCWTAALPPAQIFGGCALDDPTSRSKTSPTVFALALPDQEYPWCSGSALSNSVKHQSKTDSVDQTETKSYNNKILTHLDLPLAFDHGFSAQALDLPLSRDGMSTVE